MRRHWQKKPLLVRARAARRAGAPSTARACSRWPRATTSSRASSRATAERWSAAPGAVRAARVAAAERRRLDAAGAGRRPPRRARASAAAALPLRPRRAARRRHVLVCEPTAAASARTSTPTTSSCCRRRAGGAGAIGRARDAALRDDVPLKMLAASCRATSGCSSPATCSTCRRLGPRRRRGRRVHHRVDRLSRAGARRARARRARSASPTRREPTTADEPRYRDAGAAGDAIARRAFRRRCSASPTMRSSACSPIAPRSRARSARRSASPSRDVWFERAERRWRRRAACALDRAHPHALRRAPRLRQRRGLPRRRTRCDADAPPRRPAPARRETACAGAQRRGARAARTMAARRLVRASPAPLATRSTT